jgi:hypothetical protein
MDPVTKERVQRELKQEADKLLGVRVREVAVLEYGDDPMVEPGEVMVRVLTAEQPGERDEPPKQEAMKQLRHEIAQRLPEVRRFEVKSDLIDGKQKRFLARMDSEKDRPADGEFTPVMVRLRAPELEIIDTLINAGIAPNRAEAVRWTLARISERPAYAQLRERTSEIERLKTEF